MTKTGALLRAVFIRADWADWTVLIAYPERRLAWTTDPASVLWQPSPRDKTSSARPPAVDFFHDADGAGARSPLLRYLILVTALDDDRSRQKVPDMGHGQHAPIRRICQTKQLCQTVRVTAVELIVRFAARGREIPAPVQKT